MDESSQLRKGLQEEEERKRQEQLRKALNDRQNLPKSGLQDEPQK
jgi:hypothetical protein